MEQFIGENVTILRMDQTSSEAKINLPNFVEVEKEIT